MLTQVGLVDILRAVGIEADGIVGHSVGELGCSFMDGCFTAEQMVLAAYYRGRASLETKLIKGLMAAVGKSVMFIFFVFNMIQTFLLCCLFFEMNVKHIIAMSVKRHVVIYRRRHN